MPPDTASDQPANAPTTDSRSVIAYLVAHESSDYLAIMEVLEASITDLTPDDIAQRLRSVGTVIEPIALESRLMQLRAWGAVSVRTDVSRVTRFVDLLARNWRYIATPMGRQVQRFYRKVLAGAPAMREIPLSSLARVVVAFEALAAAQPGDADVAELCGRLFVNQDDLDAALVGAEDGLAGLVNRFDLDDTATSELKTLLVGYATHVAAELERGSARAYHAAGAVATRFRDLAAEVVRASDARLLIERGALTASRGGRLQDWLDLQAWFHPTSGRAAIFALRLVRALPGMHVNLRRLHSSSGTATSRARSLSLAKACRDPVLGTSIFLAALGDHAWKKLHGVAADEEGSGIRSWRGGPTVEVPELLRLTGRTGARGKAPAARDDVIAREAVAARRAQRAREHAEAISEILASTPGQVLSDAGARVALAALLAAARTPSVRGRKTGVRDGLACTLLHVGTATGTIRAAKWRVLTPGRLLMFHRPGALAKPVQASVRPEGDDEPRVDIDEDIA